MESRIANMYEAHVRHELDFFRPDRFRSTVETWVETRLGRLEDVTVGEWISEDLILFYIKRYVVDFPIAGGITEIIGECSRKFLSFPVHRETELKDIFNRELWDYITEKTANMEAFRNTQFHRIINSGVFARTLSDILYNGIKSFLLEENIIMRTFPQLGALLKQGKKAALKGRPEIEFGVEENIKRFLVDHLEKAIQGTEKHVVQFFTKDRLMEYADELWENQFRRLLSDHFRTVNEEDMEDFVVFGYEFWLNFRKTPFFEKVYTEIVHIVVEKFRKYSVPDMLADLGFTKAILVEESYRAILPVLDKLRDSGRLEQSIRNHLSTFYESDAALAVL